MAIDVVTLALAKKYTREYLKGKSNLTPIDGTINIVDDKIGVKVSSIEDNLVSVKDDGLFVAVESLPIEKIAGLEDRLTTIENAAIGGIHYKGSVPTVADLPTDAIQGDLYEVTEDNSEWCFNGEQWFEYGNTVDFSPIAGTGIEVDGRKVSVKISDESNGLVDVEGSLSINLATAEYAGAMSVEDKKAHDKLVALNIPTTYGKAYEVSHKPIGTLVNYNSKEIKIMCPADTEWAAQQGGGDPNKYYIGFKAYAPSSDIVSFKESLDKTMTDQTMYYFVDNEFAGIDANGRKYSIVWLPVAKFNNDSTWTYYGANSTANKFIGWNYCVEWYDNSNVCVASDLIRINLANEDCFNNIEPAYMSNYATKEDVATATISWETL